MASDGNMHFPPGQRRDKPSFEPPPWEQDQFEELAKRKRQEEELEAGKSAPTEQPEPAAPAGETTEEPAAPIAAVQQPAKRETKGAELDEKHVELLMMGLRAEEPRSDETYWRIVAASGLVSVLIGLMITTWAVIVIAAPKNPGAGQLLFEAMLLLLGLGFVGGGGWVLFKSLRQQGVL